jgi:hypothetical protein
VWAPLASFPARARYSVDGTQLSASFSTEHHEDRRALTRDCRGVLLAGLFLPPASSDFPGLEYKTHRHVDPQHGSFFTLLIETELRPSHGCYGQISVEIFAGL